MFFDVIRSYTKRYQTHFTSFLHFGYFKTGNNFQTLLMGVKIAISSLFFETSSLLRTPLSTARLHALDEGV